LAPKNIAKRTLVRLRFFIENVVFSSPLSMPSELLGCSDYSVQFVVFAMHSNQYKGNTKWWPRFIFFGRESNCSVKSLSPGHASLYFERKCDIRWNNESRLWRLTDPPVGSYSHRGHGEEPSRPKGGISPPGRVSKQRHLQLSGSGFAGYVW